MMAQCLFSRPVSHIHAAKNKKDSLAFFRLPPSSVMAQTRPGTRRIGTAVSGQLRRTHSTMEEATPEETAEEVQQAAAPPPPQKERKKTASELAREKREAKKLR